MDNYEIQHGHEEEAQEPLGLFHCIAMDFGGDDNCLDESEFKAMWKAVFGEDAEAPMNFFYVMDMDGNGCVDGARACRCWNSW